MYDVPSAGSELRCSVADALSRWTSPQERARRSQTISFWPPPTTLCSEETGVSASASGVGLSRFTLSAADIFPRELWYKNRGNPAFKPKGLWSPIYQFINAGENLPGLTYTVPYVRAIDGKEKYIGATMVDINLSLLSRFLLSQRASKNSITALIERTTREDSHRPDVVSESGSVIAVSNGENITFGGWDGSKLTAAITFHNSLVQSAAQHIVWRYGSWKVGRALLENSLYLSPHLENVVGCAFQRDPPGVRQRVPFAAGLQDRRLCQNHE